MNLWGKVKINAPKRNTFSDGLSHEHKTTGNYGWLYPILWMEVLPGETIHLETQVLLRFVPMLAPIMHFLNISVASFFVPNRLLWSGWQDFITQGVSGTDAPAFPSWKVADANAANVRTGWGSGVGLGLRNGSLLDHLGFPTMPVDAVAHPYQAEYDTSLYSALPLRAYLLIWNEWFRNPSIDADAVAALPNFLAGGVTAAADLNTLLSLAPVNYEKDYFTGALPAPQRGVAASSLDTASTTGGPIPVVRDAATGGPAPAGQNLVTGAGGILQRNTGPTSVYIDPNGSTFITAQAIRAAEKLQKFSEKRNIAGPRYIEQLRVFFGVISSDARLQRPELCGTGRQQLAVTEVMQLSAANAQPTPLGTLAGRGISHGQSGSMGGYFEEHGIFMTLLRVVPQLAYVNVLHKKWTALSFGDYYFEDFAHLGEETVFRAETFRDFSVVGGQARGAQTFGYNPRYSKYKFEPSIATGQLKESLSYWHLNRINQLEAQLNSQFIQVQPDQRIFADTSPTDDHFIAQIVHRIVAKRPIPYFSEPGL